MKVTSFGSCRQHALSNHFQLTSIQERLTYPHYTKEIVQAIEFCKGISSSDVETLSPFLFRSGILSKRPLKGTAFLNEFQTTDLFVIEIASRQSYRYRDFYVHHILTESAYEFPERHLINVYTQIDEEIEADLLRIKALLSPKPFIVVSHVYTRVTGSRYTLVRLLEQLCAKHTIPFLDPMTLLPEPLELLFDHDDTNHYTSVGHEAIGLIYQKFIQQTLRTAQPPSLPGDS
jgi:hypothetical protein